MIAVKDAVALMPDVEEINLVWSGCTIPIHPTNELEMDAFGSYAVGRILPVNPRESEGHCAVEIEVVAMPLKVS